MDYIQNGQGFGGVAQQLLQAEGNPGALRPFVGNDGRSYITVPRHNAKTGVTENVAVPTQNSVATLRHEDWRLIDTQVLKAARSRLKLVADLRSRGLTYTVPNGMGKTVLSTERMTDPGGAQLSMDGMGKTPNARPEFDMVNLPLPIAHEDFFFSARQIMVSRNSGNPLDTTMAEAAARRVAEVAEQLAIGSYGTFTFGGGSIYGITNYPDRNLKTLTAPTATAWTPVTTTNEVLAMKAQSVADKKYGPWVLYASTGWDQYLDRDYVAAGGNNPNQTLRERLKKIEGIVDVVTLDFLTGLQLVLVEQTSETIREVLGMDITTVQWETHGGMQINYKVMAILVPQIRSDINGNCGIVHGS